MATYLVEYRIDIEAETPQEAAQLAHEACMNPHYATRVWTVTSESGDQTEVHVDTDGCAVAEPEVQS